MSLCACLRGHNGFIYIIYDVSQSTSKLNHRYLRVVKGGGGYRSRLTENKTALSQFTKNIKFGFHASRKIKENILENHCSRRLWNSRFTSKKRAISHFTGNKKGRSRVTKIPFTTLLLASVSGTHNLSALQQPGLL